VRKEDWIVQNRREKKKEKKRKKKREKKKRQRKKRETRIGQRMVEETNERDMSRSLPPR